MVSKMLAGLVPALCCSALYVSTPAMANETLSCSFIEFDGPPGASGRATIEINDDDLIWKLDPIILPTMKVPATEFHYRILQNNDIGIVAVESQTENPKDIGPELVAHVIIISRANMNLRLGSVGIDRVYDGLTAACEEKTSYKQLPDNN